MHSVFYVINSREPFVLYYTKVYNSDLESLTKNSLTYLSFKQKIYSTNLKVGKC